MPFYPLDARRARFATPAAQFFSQPLSRKPRAQPHAPPCTMRAAMVAPQLAKTCLTGSPNGLRRPMKRPVLRYNGAFSGENATAAPPPSGCAATPPRLFFLPPRCIFLPRAGIMSAICIIFA